MMSIKRLIPISLRRAIGEATAPYAYPQYLFATAIRRRLPRRANRLIRVLDAPCGRGETSWLLARQRQCVVDGMDIAEWAIEYAKKRFASPRITFVAGDLYKDLEGKESAYDAVCIINSLFCLPDASSAMAIARRLVADDGKVFVPIPNHQSHDFLAFQKQDPHLNQTILSRTEAADFFRSHGFEVVEELELGRTTFRRKFFWSLLGPLSHIYLILADRIRSTFKLGTPGYFLFVLVPNTKDLP